MKCARCSGSVEPTMRFCGFCGLKRDDSKRLTWDDQVLAAASDPPLRRKYRLLQSWYRQYLLDADYGYSVGKAPRPVGSLLAAEAVAEDPALNFLGDPAILRYVDKRVPEVRAASGSLDEHRLRTNMLSSMPMAFSFVAALRQAHDRAAIVSKLFDVSCDEVVDVFAEWTPDRPKADLLNDRTAFDAAILYRRGDGGTGMIGIETKYTEPLSQIEYDTARYREVTERCGWFRSGAADELVARSTNQLWRNVMLAATAMGLTVDDAHLAIIGLDEDGGLWNSADLLAAQMTAPRRLLLRPWNQVVDVAGSSSMEVFARRFTERYLDTSPLGGTGVRGHLRRVVRPTKAEHQWTSISAPLPKPSPASAGEVGDWGRWVPAVWRALSDPARVLAVPFEPPSDFEETLAWWTPLVQLMTFSLAWQSPARGLLAWHNAGRPVDDARLSLIQAIWGRNLDPMFHYLWHGYGSFEEEVSAALGSPSVPRPGDSPDLPALTGASTARSNPATGGSDPLHLSMHYSLPTERDDDGSVTLTVCDPDAGGPARALLQCSGYRGWYRALHERGNELAGRPDGHGWRVDVIVEGIGFLGTYRRSRQTSRWFAGRHEAHQLGVA